MQAQQAALLHSMKMVQDALFNDAWSIMQEQKWCLQVHAIWHSALSEPLLTEQKFLGTFPVSIFPNHRSNPYFEKSLSVLSAWGGRAAHRKCRGQ